MAELWLITGGVRSGKSRLAVRLAGEYGGPVTYVATAEPRDEEMAVRILRHRDERPPEWTTVEEPHDLVTALANAGAGAGAVIVDCLTLWTANRLAAILPQEDPGPDATASAQLILEVELDAALETIAARPDIVIAVTNEVGSGVIAAHANVRAYVEALGMVNQRCAAAAQRVYACTAGLALELKRAGARPVDG